MNRAAQSESTGAAAAAAAAVVGKSAADQSTAQLVSAQRHYATGYPAGSQYPRYQQRHIGPRYPRQAAALVRR